MKNENDQFFDEVSKLFLKFGIKSLTMDDIARELGISKKTIYAKVKDKKQLVHEVMNNRLCFEEDLIHSVFEKNMNSIDELFEICKLAGEVLQTMHPSVMFDLKKYYPETWNSFMEHKQSHILDSVKRNLQKGVDNGIFRKELKVDIIARIYIAKMETIFDQSVFDPENYNVFEVYLEMLIYHIHGVANDKGIELLEKKIKELKLN